MKRPSICASARACKCHGSNDGSSCKPRRASTTRKREEALYSLWLSMMPLLCSRLSVREGHLFSLRRRQPVTAPHRNLRRVGPYSWYRFEDRKRPSANNAPSRRYLICVYQRVQGRLGDNEPVRSGFALRRDQTRGLNSWFMYRWPVSLAVLAAVIPGTTSCA